MTGDRVRRACPTCGGGPDGFLRRLGAGGHAVWCAWFNARQRAGWPVTRPPKGGQ